MSGPKCYSPPPARYSVEVFDGLLAQVFEAQIALRELAGQLERSIVREHDVAFDCQTVLQATAAQRKKALAPVTVEQTGTFGQQVHDQIARGLSTRLERLEQLVGSYRLEHRRFEEKRADLEAFLAYQQHCHHLHDRFIRMRADVLSYLREYATSVPSKRLEHALRRIAEVEPTQRTVGFAFGFRKQAESARAAIEQQFADEWAKIERLRSDLDVRCKGVLSDDRKTRRRPAGLAPLARTLRQKIDEFDDSERRGVYQKRFERLLESEVLQDDYYFRELKQDLEDEQATRVIKEGIRKLLQSHSALADCPSLASECAELTATARDLLEASRLKPHLLTTLEARVERLVMRAADISREEAMVAKEREFLRRQVVQALRRMGYDVLEDMTVLDLSQPCDVLLEVPDQDNVVSVSFRADGSFVYRFLIPENASELGLSKQREKLDQMEATCATFKSVVRELQDMGVPLELNRHRPVGNEALLQVPEKHREKLEARRRRRKAAAKTRQRSLRAKKMESK
jgi:bacterioferritin-associated ferredoxin